MSPLSLSCFRQPLAEQMVPVQNANAFVRELEYNPRRLEAYVWRAVAKVFSQKLFFCGALDVGVVSRPTFHSVDSEIAQFVCAEISKVFVDAIHHEVKIWWPFKTELELCSCIQTQFSIVMVKENRSFKKEYLDEYVRSFFLKQLVIVREQNKTRLQNIVQKAFFKVFSLESYHEGVVMPSSLREAKLYELVSAECRELFPEWLFSLQTIRECIRQKIEAFCSERHEQMTEWIRHIVFLWLRTLPKENVREGSRLLPSVMPQILPSLQREFLDLPLEVSTIEKQSAQACTRILEKVVVDDLGGLKVIVFPSEDQIFHSERHTEDMRKKAVVVLQLCVKSWFGSSRRDRLVEKVQNVLRMRGYAGGLSPDEFEQEILKYVVLLQVDAFNDTLQRRFVEGEIVPEFLSGSHYLFPDKPEHKELFNQFCARSFEEIRVQVSQDFTRLLGESLERTIRKTAHDAFNEIIRKKMMLKYASEGEGTVQ